MLQEQLPTQFYVISPVGPASFTIQIQVRKAILKADVEPAVENAWVYRAKPNDGSTLPNYLGPVINLRRGQRVQITWQNTLGEDPAKPGQQLAPPFPQDCPSTAPPDMGKCAPFGVVTHLHGGKVQGGADGWPLQPTGYEGNPSFPTTRTFHYSNEQRATMLWYHDHAMDHTAPNVYSGLAGLYFIRDQTDDALFSWLGGSEYEIPLVIQDRLMATDNQSFKYECGIPRNGNRGEFLGDTLFVNGRASPRCDLQRHIYRLRILNGSNARTYALALYNPDTGEWLTNRLTLIGTEGGLLASPVPLATTPNPADSTGLLIMGSAERRDVLLDLTGLCNVSHLQLVNLAVNSLLGKIKHPDPGILPTDSEGIYTTPQESIIRPSSVDDTVKKLGVFKVLDVHLKGADHPVPPLFYPRVGLLLRANTSGEGFHWNPVTSRVEPLSWAVRKNRLVLLYNNTVPENSAENWDVRLCEMSAGADGTETQWLPFQVDLNRPLPAPQAQPQASENIAYTIARRTFFEESHAMCDIQYGYPKPHATDFKPKAGTYERWYVANIGNELYNGTIGKAPDMHPLHIHLVNFIVTRRWRRVDAGQPFLLIPDADSMDNVARYDTVRVHPNEIVELVLYFPKGYHGKYPYHCHLVEHEDMGMMLHFEVD